MTTRPRYVGDPDAAQDDRISRPARGRPVVPLLVLAAFVAGVLLVAITATGLGVLLPWEGGSPGDRQEADAQPSTGGRGGPESPSTPRSPEPPSSRDLPSDAVAASVLDITDGDTLTTDRGVVRIHGIDTPEAGDPSADQATATLAALAPVGAVVYLWVAPGADSVDRYDRLVRTVLLDDGTDVGEQLVARGLARAYVQYSDRYVAVEATARDRQLGIWEGWEPPPSTSDPSGSSSGSATEDEPWNRPGPDLDCADIGKRVQITGEDFHNLDADGDGVGCESYS